MHTSENVICDFENTVWRRDGLILLIELIGIRQGSVEEVFESRISVKSESQLLHM